MRLPKRIQLKYNEPGILKGHTPNGQFVTVQHTQSGPSGYRVLWDDKWYQWLYSDLVENELGIKVRRKKSGDQVGYPSEAVIRALWRYFVDLYNRGDPNVDYST